MLIVKILKHKREYAWYRNRIGELFNVADNPKRYHRRTVLNIVDGKAVEEDDPNYKKPDDYYRVIDENGITTNKHILCHDCKVMGIGDKIKKIQEKIKSKK